MSIWNIIILSGVAAATLIAMGNIRYLAWLGAIISAYAISVLYWDASGPYAEFVAGICDLTIVVLIAWKARYIWELWVSLMFLGSALVNWSYLANNITGANLIGHDVYSSILEIINIAAIMTIGGVASFDKAGMYDGLAFRPWVHFFGRLRHVYARRDPRS